MAISLLRKIKQKYITRLNTKISNIQGSGILNYYRNFAENHGGELYRFCEVLWHHYYHENVAPLKKLGRKGEGSYFFPTASIRYPENIYFGDNVYTNHNCCFWGSPNAKITVGDYATFGPGIVIVTSNYNHQMGIPFRDQPWKEKDVKIGSYVWIGANAVILPGTEIGDGSIIGAGAVVSGKIPPNSVSVGVPAKPVKIKEN